MPTLAGLLLMTAMILGGCYPDRPIPQPVMTPAVSPEEPVALPTSGRSVQ